MGSIFFFQGFFLSLGLLMVIGPQNAFILRQGVLRQYVFSVALISSLADAVLMSCGVFGLSDLLNVSVFLHSLVKWASIFFLFCYGFYLLFFLGKNSRGVFDDCHRKSSNFQKTVVFLLCLIFFNPKVYLDTVVLFGAVGAQLEHTGRVFFLAGGILASFVWFFSLIYGSRLLLPLLQSPKAFRVLDICTGCSMWIVMSLVFLFS